MLGAVVVWFIMLYGQHIIQKEQTSFIVYEDGITRGEVLKAIALALTDKETCEAVEKNYFSEENIEAWYTPYANYLYEKGIIQSDTIVPIHYSFEQNIETLELKKILYRLNMVEVANRLLQAEDRQVVLETLWWKIYEQILDFYDRGYEVTTKTIKVCGTISNITEAKPWQVYTNEGVMGFDGLALDYYIDSEIEVLQRNGEIIHINKLLNRDITYENVWIMKNELDEIQVFLYGIVRSFSFAPNNNQVQIANLGETIGDITLQNGTVVHVKEKSQSIQSKVLAVHEDSIELEGYGLIPLTNGFQVYQLYDGIKIKEKEDIMIGYTTQQFILQDGKICTALLLKQIEITQIRVLLMTTAYTSYYHTNVQLIAQQDLMLMQGNEIMWYPAGSVIDINAETFKKDGDKHIHVKSDGEIGINSIARTQGTPYYGGILDLTLTEQGILIVNELPLEDYLLKVVPSEMPARYGIETAKIQAICARSFAIGQIEKNACGAYGAHVDDSTSYQVYNNIAQQEYSTQGVRQTQGMVLTDKVTNHIISTWYYSTSCGFGTDNRSWGSTSVASYIQAKEISEQGFLNQLDVISESVLSMQNEDAFRQWITNWNVETYESDMTWFRWKFDMTLEQLQAQLQQTLPSVIQSYGKYVFAVDEMGNERRAETSDFGDLISMEVKSRGVGGIVQELYIKGTAQTLVVRYQTAIRRLLGDKARVYTNFSSTGSSISSSALLPSAFFCLVPMMTEAIVEEDSEENAIVEEFTGYTIYGGGIGHGIGMSQNAAKAMCDTGIKAEDVLLFFYPGADIINIYEK